MRPGSNPIEEYKQTKHGNPLLIREDLPGLINDGWEALSPGDKELLKWIGVFFRKPTPGKFMMRIRMPNGFATSTQLAAIADLSKRLGNGAVDITTRQQIELRGYTLETVPEIFERLRGVDLRTLQTGQDNVRNINGCALAGLTPTELLDASRLVFALDRTIVGSDGNPGVALRTAHTMNRKTSPWCRRPSLSMERSILDFTSWRAERWGPAALRLRRILIGSSSRIKRMTS
ncbi:MAG: hypothetical protein DMG18_02435 [Acidobacteria bacterium]|nr:MAG: hypothetical protein DMG18_02435 [Acidobacteriota bacterium]